METDTEGKKTSAAVRIGRKQDANVKEKGRRQVTEEVGGIRDRKSRIWNKNGKKS